ncbi:MAG: type III secretion HpaP family protein [Pseudomonadota bacterium]
MHKIDNQHLHAMQTNAIAKQNPSYRENHTQVPNTISFNDKMKENQSAFENKMSNVQKNTNTNSDANTLHQSEDKDTSLFAQSSLFSAQARHNATSTQDNNNSIKEQSVSCNNSMMNAVDLMEKLSQTILVSASKLDGTKEIHIHLKNDILAQTEIQLKLDGKNLEVQFVTSAQETSNFLSQHAPSLHNILQSKQEGLVTIGVTCKDPNASQQSGDHKIVHQGAEASNDSSGDGRSRQQRNIFEELLEKRL